MRERKKRKKLLNREILEVISALMMQAGVDCRRGGDIKSESDRDSGPTMAHGKSMYLGR